MLLQRERITGKKKPALPPPPSARGRTSTSSLDPWRNRPTKLHRESRLRRYSSKPPSRPALSADAVSSPSAIARTDRRTPLPVPPPPHCTQRGASRGKAPDFTDRSSAVLVCGCDSALYFYQPESNVGMMSSPRFCAFDWSELPATAGPMLFTAGLQGHTHPRVIAPPKHLTPFCLICVNITWLETEFFVSFHS